MELAYMRGMLENTNTQMQEIRDALQISPDEDIKETAKELYEHPWYKYKREQILAEEESLKILSDHLKTNII
jgi:stress response protein YsnF